MKNRLFLFAFALLFTFAPQANAQAKFDKAPERSKIRGLMLGASLNGSALRVEDSEDIESGGGASLKLGYGFNNNLSALMAFHGANVEHYGTSETYTLAHFDLGLRYSFRDASVPGRPYLGAALTGRGAFMDAVGVDLRGAGATINGGAEYFFSPGLSLDIGLAYTFGKFSEGRIQGENEWVEFGDDAFNASSTRFDLGVSMHL